MKLLTNYLIINNTEMDAKCFERFFFSESLFLKPIKLEKESAWIGHIPFAHWVIEVFKPQILVELGTHSGNSYSAFCNSVKYNHYETKCFAVDTWQGDAQAGYYEEHIYSNLSSFNSENFGSFSTLLKMKFDEALNQFPDGTIDLLHIDGFHSYEAVSHDFQTWLPKLSDRAIVLFHDIAEKTDGFGVWKFWEEVIQKYPYFNFEHSHGLGVLQVGKNSNEILKALFSLNETQAHYVRNLFSAIGENWKFIVKEQLIEASHNEVISTIKNENAKMIEAYLQNHQLMQEQYNNDISLISEEHAYHIEEILNNSEEIQNELNITLNKEREDYSKIIENKQTEINSLYDNIWLFNTQIHSLEEDSLWRYLRKHPKLKRTLTKYISYIRKLFKGKLKQERRRFKKAKEDAIVIKSSSLFDAVWYRQKYFDVIYSGFSPEMHYALFGRDGRAPSLQFNASKYLEQNKDVYDSDFIPLVHYEEYGKNERRNIYECSEIDNTKMEINAAATLTLKLNEDDLYKDWIEKIEDPRIQELENSDLENDSVSSTPFFSIILPTYNTPVNYLKECIESVQNQTFKNWELCIADDASTNKATIHLIEKFKSKDDRIRLVKREKNGHISAASNSALAIARGTYITLLDHDDVLAATALQEIAIAIKDNPNAEILYSDEDKLNKSGKRTNPFFKPDFSIDLLFSQNYICHLTTYKKELIEKIGGFRLGYEGSQDYDLVLRAIGCIDSIKNIIHIPRILYHWRMVKNSTAMGHSEKDYATDAAVKAIQNYLDAQKLNAQVSIIEDGRYKLRWEIPNEEPLVSLIIATRDGYDDLKTCIDSIIEKTTYKKYEIIVVDNQSSDRKTLNYFKEIERLDNVRVVVFDYPFNYSAINNFGVKYANGEIIGLINNDIEVISEDWLTEMVSHVIREDIGCVGAKLLYPDRTIQHAGVVLGIGGVAGHSHKNMKEEFEGYFSKLRIVHNVSAVTGAALLVRKDIFSKVGGLDEKDLKVAFNDIDLCLKVQNLGFRNIWTPFAVLIHHESKSRGLDNTPEKMKRFLGEVDVMKKRWGDTLKNDPYYNPNLTLVKEDYSIMVAI